MNGTLTKLTIQAYSKPEMADNDKKGEFTTTLNPEKYSRVYKTEYNSEAAQGSSSASSKFVRSDPQELDLEFLFDRTGILGNTGAGVGAEGVEEDVKNFLSIAYSFQGKIHQPNFLKITWGTLTFNCILTEIQIEYKLFQSDGLPIRAVAKAKFKDFVSEQKRVAKENRNSPDLTHVRMVKAGDTLPLMCYEIYGDSKYYVEIAKVNKIASFRSLTPGQQIYFPPIEKRS